MPQRRRAPRNRTLTLSPAERKQYAAALVRLSAPATIGDIENTIICQDLFEILHLLPGNFVDLLFIDPPYNANKKFRAAAFRRLSAEDYAGWMERWFVRLLPTLKQTASVYICADWRCSSAVESVAAKYLTVRNRITWEREKGRGSGRNWKNAAEDVWFCTVSDNYCFNVEAVKLMKKVIAPYRDGGGRPKGWEQTAAGGRRLTFPSNLWTDLTVPFWSMPENTDHPTQKPEKLLAKIILASSNRGDFVFDPFAGVGTAPVVAKKLDRRFLGIEVDELFACLASKRLDRAETDRSIQGYRGGIFLQRNTPGS